MLGLLDMVKHLCSLTGKMQLVTRPCGGSVPVFMAGGKGNMCSMSRHLFILPNKHDLSMYTYTNHVSKPMTQKAKLWWETKSNKVAFNVLLRKKKLAKRLK